MMRKRLLSLLLRDGCESQQDQNAKRSTLNLILRQAGGAVDVKKSHEFVALADCRAKKAFANQEGHVL